MHRLALALVALTSLASCGGNQVSTPAVEFADFDRLDAVLAQHRGHGVLLNLWAMWCEPCVKELPELLEVAHESASDGGDVLLLSYDLMIEGPGRDKVLETVRGFAARRHIEAPILIYDALDTDALDKRFDLPGPIPVTLAFDRAGKLVDRQDGSADKARFTEMMRKTLAR